MMHTLRRAALTALLLAPFAMAGTAHAQTPTPEGTVIRNIASVSFTDANNNSYAPVADTVDVTVGFLAGPDVIAPAVSVSPPSPSSGNVLAFTITNSGNGTDSVTVASSIGAGLSGVTYRYNGTVYPTLAALNAALASVAIPAGSSITVEVLYTVDSGRGGQTSPVTLTATSRRTPTASDAGTTNVTPPVSNAVTVTPDNLAVSQLPSNGVVYEQDFVVTNNGNATDNFNLAASLSGSAVSIVSVNGTAGTTGTVSLAVGASATVKVRYTVANVAAGSQSTLTLTATSTTTATVTDPGSIVVTVIRAAVTIDKTAYRDNQSTVIGSADRVIPQEYIQYRITVTNAGGAPASTVSVTDVLPSQVTFESASGDAAGWTISSAGGTVTATLSGTLATGASRFFWLRVRVK